LILPLVVKSAKYDGSRLKGLFPFISVMTLKKQAQNSTFLLIHSKHFRRQLNSEISPRQNLILSHQIEDCPFRLTLPFWGFVFLKYIPSTFQDYNWSRESSAPASHACVTNILITTLARANINPVETPHSVQQLLTAHGPFEKLKTLRGPQANY
jgi:hypothetical protein